MACRDAQIAQSVEQRIENPRVRGSIPRLGTIILKSSFYSCFFYACKKIQESIFLLVQVTPLSLKAAFELLFYACNKSFGISIPAGLGHTIILKSSF